MKELIKQTFEKILQLSEEQQNTLAQYLQNNLDSILEKAEHEKYIDEGNYTVDDLNEETQDAIANIENRQSLTVCEDKNDLYHKLEI